MATDDTFHTDTIASDEEITNTNAKPSNAEADTGDIIPDKHTFYSPATTTSAIWSARGQFDARGEMRKSCDYCGIRKRKCDGKGTSTCSLCKKKGLVCTYSKKLSSQPHRWSWKQAHGDVGGCEHMESLMSLCNKKGLPCTYSKKQTNRPRRSSRDQDYGNDWVLPHAQSLKRCRLSPSPATGLVGLAVNVLLGAYFECMGFVPITSQSNVREGIARIMTSRIATSTREMTRGTGEIIHHSLPSDPSLCSFWFAVAMGGLVQGRPREAVSSYIRRAKAAMHAYSKVPTPESARAWLQMAMMSAFSGDLDSFSIDVGRAVQVVRDLKNQDSLNKMQPGLHDLIKHSQVLLLLLGKRNQDDMQSFVSHDLGPSPQVGSIVTLEEIARFTMHDFRRHGQAFVVDALAKQNRGKPEVENMNPFGAHDVEGGVALCLGQRPDPLPDVVITDKYFVMGNTGKLPRKVVPTYERLENFAKGPSIRSGIGSLVINVPLCLTRIAHLLPTLTEELQFAAKLPSAFPAPATMLELMARHDTSGALETVSRAVEVLLRYPGLIRFEIGMHVCHLLFTVLSILEAAEIFMKLRTAFNKHLPRDPAIPPIKEWEDVEPYCSDMFCRATHRKLLDRLPPQTEFGISDVVKEAPGKTIFPNGKSATEAEHPSTTGTVCGTQLKQWLAQPTVTSVDLGYQNKLGVGSTMAGGEKRGTLDTSALSSIGKELDATTGLAFCLGDPENSLDQVEEGGLQPKDWEIAIDALLEDDTTDLALNFYC